MLLLVLFLSTLCGVLAQSNGVSECNNYYDEGWRCVPYWLCSENRTIIRDGGGLVDIRTVDAKFGDELPEKSHCEKLAQVCCLLEEEGGIEVKRPVERDTPAVVPLPIVTACGKRNAAGLGESNDVEVNNEAEKGEWLHVCMIHKKEEYKFPNDTILSLSVYFAGASLIAPGVILTGALVVDGQDLKDLTIRCGEWDTTNSDPVFPFQERHVKDVKIHPNFNPKNAFNNIAVLYTDEDFDISVPHVNPVCLPRPLEAVDIGSDCYANGWGKDRFGSGGKYSTRMKEVRLPMVSNQKCEDKLRSTRLGEYFQLHESFVCAGGNKNLDTCKGDGGSPLICQTRNQDWAQVGIVAWGISCNSADIPGVYTNVAQFTCWIDEVVSEYLRLEESYFGLVRTLDCK